MVAGSLNYVAILIQILHSNSLISPSLSYFISKIRLIIIPPSKEDLNMRGDNAG